MEKLLTVAIPSYNSEAYLSHAVESLLPGGKEVEILIVDDGSRDETATIADDYERKYPGIIRALHKENGGHGDAVMYGIANASGLYFKVVDSDDWVDFEAYPQVLSALRNLVQPEMQVDLFIADYVYDKVGAENKHVIRYTNCLPTGRVFGWKDVGNFRIGQYILMHSAIYRTQVLRECGMVLPKHTFYVDNLYVFVPMTHVEKMYYLDAVFYHYFIGREDQSVHEEVMIRRIDQQLKVNRLMVSQVDLPRVTPEARRKYMLSYLEIITAISIVLLIRSGTEENLGKKDELWRWMESQYPETYSLVRHSAVGVCLHLRGRIGRWFINWSYKLAQKIYGFN